MNLGLVGHQKSKIDLFLIKKGSRDHTGILPYCCSATVSNLSQPLTYTRGYCGDFFFSLSAMIGGTSVEGMQTFALACKHITVLL